MLAGASAFHHACASQLASDHAGECSTACSAASYCVALPTSLSHDLTACLHSRARKSSGWTRFKSIDIVQALYAGSVGGRARDLDLASESRWEEKGK